MNKIYKLIASLFAVGIMSLPFSVKAQSTNNVVSTNVVSNTNSNQTGVGQAWTDFTTVVLGSKTNWTFVPFAVIAPGAKNGKVGGGLGAFYNVNTYVLAGLRGEWLDGGWWLPSGTMTLQLPTKPLQFVGKGALWQNFTFTPLAYGGVGYPISGLDLGGTTVPGKNNLGTGPIGIAGVGGSISIFSTDNVSIHAVADIEDWTGLPQHVYNIGLAVRFKI